PLRVGTAHDRSFSRKPQCLRLCPPYGFRHDEVSRCPGLNGRRMAKNAGIAIRYATPATHSTDMSPNEVAMIGTSAAPMTEKQPLIPQAHRNMWCFPSRPSVVIAVGIGKPIRNAGGDTSTKQNRSRTT